MTKLPAEAYAIVEGRHSDPFRYLGPHHEDDRTVVRAFLPDATGVDAIDDHGEVAALERVHDAGLFIGDVAQRLQPLPVARALRRQMSSSSTIPIAFRRS